MPVKMLCSEVYLEIKKYDIDNETSCLKTILCYLEHDCNATHTAQALFLHRNTVQNVVHFAKERWGLELSDAETKRQQVLSGQADKYLEFSKAAAGRIQ